MIYCIFCYKNDAELVPMCVERVKELDPEAVIYLADDAAAPMPDNAAPEGCRYLRTGFRRGGNLNGLEAVAGVLDTLRWCLDDAGERWVVKLDCDTWLNSVEWLKTGREEYIAAERCQPFTPAGNCYCMRKHAVVKALEYLQVRSTAGTWPSAWHYPEDRTIWEIVRELKVATRLMPYTSGFTRGYHDEVPVPQAVLDATVVHCGEPLAAGERAHRAHVALRMRVVAEACKKLKAES